MVEKNGRDADNIRDMILCRTEKLPGTLAPEIVKLIEEQGKELLEGNLQ